MSSMDNAISIPQAIHVLHQAVLLGQKAGIYSFNDSALIKNSLDSLKYRLHLDDNFKPISHQVPPVQKPVQQPQQLIQENQRQHVEQNLSQNTTSNVDVVVQDQN